MDNDRKQLVDNIRIAIEQELDETSILKSAAHLIDEFSEDFNWTGFYMLQDGDLVVGPYIGPETENKKIALSEGICGAAATEMQSIIVNDTRNDSRFLACSLSTRSEIVVPLVDGDSLIGEIDIDSDRPSNFNKADQIMLEEVAKVIVNRLKATGQISKNANSE